MKKGIFKTPDGRVYLGMLFDIIIPGKREAQAAKIQGGNVETFSKLVNPNNEKYNTVAIDTRKSYAEGLRKYADELYITKEDVYGFLSIMHEVYDVNIDYYKEELDSGADIQNVIEIIFQDAWMYPEQTERFQIAYNRLKLPNEIYILLIADDDAPYANIDMVIKNIRLNRPYDIIVDDKVVKEHRGLYDIIYLIANKNLKDSFLKSIEDLVKSQGNDLIKTFYVKKSVELEDSKSIVSLCNKLDIEYRTYSADEVIIADAYKDIENVIYKIRTGDELENSRLIYLSSLLDQGRYNVVSEIVNSTILENLASLNSSNLIDAQVYCKEYITEKEKYISILSDDIASNSNKIQEIYDVLEKLAFKYNVRSDIVLEYSKYLDSIGRFTDAIKKGETLSYYYEFNAASNEARINLYKFLGDMYNKTKKSLKAYKYYQMGMLLTDDDYNKASLMHLSARVLWQGREYKLAKNLITENIQKIEDLYKTDSEKYFLILAGMYQLLGNIFLAQQSLKDAETYYNYANVNWKNHIKNRGELKNDEEKLKYSTLLMMRGILYRRLKEYKKGVNEYDKSIEIREELYKANPVEYVRPLGICYSNKAFIVGKAAADNTLFNQDDIQFATSLFHKAIDYKKQILDKNQNGYRITMFYSYYDYGVFCRDIHSFKAWEENINISGDYLAKALLSDEADRTMISPSNIKEFESEFINELMNYWYQKGSLYYEHKDYSLSKEYIEAAYFACKKRIYTDDNFYTKQIATYSFGLLKTYFSVGHENLSDFCIISINHAAELA